MRGPRVTVVRQPGESVADFLARVDAVAAAGPARAGHLTCPACVILGAVPWGPPYWALRWHLARMGRA
jgi:hypothetical protein